jgi:hypothetical protein
MMNFLWLLFWLVWESARQEWAVRRRLLPRLRRGGLSAAAGRRVLHYARLAPTLAALNVRLLLGRGLSGSERANLLIISALAPLYDDFFDQKNASPARLRALLRGEGGLGAMDAEEQLVADFAGILRAGMPRFPQFLVLSERVFEAQLAAKRQELGGLSRAELRAIAFDKGGFGARLFATLLARESVPGEAEVLHQLGGMVQLVDDVFDVWADVQAGVQTLATSSGDARAMWDFFDAELARLFELCGHLALPEGRIRRFLAFQLLFFSLAAVCLRQHLELQERAGGRFEPARHSRRDLVCDMARWRNRWRWARFWWAYRRRFLARFAPSSPSAF